MTVSTVLQDVDVRRLGSALGAEVRGISLAGADAATAAAIGDLLTEHLVLFFPTSTSRWSSMWHWGICSGRWRTIPT